MKIKKLLIFAVLTVAVIVGFRLTSRSTSEEVQQAAPQVEAGPSLAQPVVRVNGEVAQARLEEKTSALNTLKPRDITLGHIRQIKRQGGREVLVFKDDSELTVTPYVQGQLAPEVSVRLRYARQ